MKHIIVKILLGGSVLVSSMACEKFLSTEPVDKVSSESFFKTETDLTLYANGLLQSYRPSAEGIGQGDNYSDLISSKTSTDFYKPGVWIPSKQGGWAVSDWKSIRRANIMIASLEKNKDLFDQTIYNHYMGVARFWRAYFYYSKVKTFGDVPWIDRVLSVDDEALSAPRDDREFVMSKVLEDINFACANLSGDEKYKGVINKYVALALKSRICLYEGAYRKYHAVNPSTNEPWNGKYESSEDFYRASIAASEEIINSGKYALNTGTPETVYESIWRNNKFSTTSEAIWTAEYEDGDVPTLHELTWRVNSSSYDQQCQPTKNLVRMFLNLDGTYANPAVSITKEFENRDWRLFNTVHGPGHTYMTILGESKLKPLNFGYTMTGYQFRKWSQERDENYSRGRNDNDIPIYRYAEVLLNLAEAKAELDELTQDVWDQTIGKLRTRAGVKSIYPGSAEYVEDTWLKSYYGPTNLSNFVLEVRRERVTEMICENLRVDDLFRWNCGELIVNRTTDNSGWVGIYVTEDEAKNGLTFNETLYKFKGSHSDVSYPVSNSTNDGNFSFSLDGKTPGASYGYLIYHYTLEWNERNYVRPIPTSAFTKNDALRQNYGWEE